MKRQAHQAQFTFVVIILSVLINACSLPNNTVVIGATSTSTAANLPMENNPTATSALEQATESSSVPEIQNFDVCGFFTAADAEPIVGTALIEVTQGSEIDDVTGGPMNFCTYKGDDVALVLSIVKSNAIKDSAEWQGQLLEITQASEPSSATPATDLGEQSYWMVLEDAAGWNVAKYPYVFALVVGGNIGYSEDYKEDLKTLAQRVVNSLP